VRKGKIRDEIKTVRGACAMKEGCRDLKDVMSCLKEYPEIKFIRMVYPDILGQMRDQSVPVERVEGFFGDGAGFDGSSVTGLREGVSESDLIFHPEAKTFVPMPWVYEGKTKTYLGKNHEPQFPTWREAIVFGYIHTPEGEHFEGDARYVLKSVLDKEKKSGFFDEMMVGTELEFFLFPDDRTPVPTDSGEYHLGGLYGELRKEVQLLFENMNWECDHHEVARGQHELDLKYTNALDMADRVMLMRYAIKRIAKSNNLYATFMPKPVNGENGSGMHVHQSLWKDGANLFFDAAADYNLSAAARGYIAGLMKYGPEFTLVWNQWVNSYKRLVPGYEAPTYVAWGRQNRSAYIRVPEYSRGKNHAARVELRSPDPALNPYLGFATMLAVGIEGIRSKIKFSEPVEDNIFEMNAALRQEKEISDLPGDMGVALEAFEGSEFARRVLGEHVWRELVRNKRHEWSEYNLKVTDYEIERYLPNL
jgi:glutamine synthetase